MISTPLAIPDIQSIIPKRHSDHRGYFSESFRTDWFQTPGQTVRFLQDNVAVSKDAGTLRGLHFQSGPSAQAKLIGCLSGAIYDVAVDIRLGSPTYGKSVGTTLSSENGAHLFIPPGFAHGYVTLVPDSLVFYKVDRLYDPYRDHGILWNDPKIDLEWPIDIRGSALSPKDQNAPKLEMLPKYFTYNPDAPFRVDCHDRIKNKITDKI